MNTLPRYARPMCGWPHGVDLCRLHEMPFDVCDCEDHRFVDYSTCHCGDPIRYGYDGDPKHHRGMCEHCDSVRCDAYPGACKR